MSDIDRKLNNFTSAVVRQSRLDSERIIASVQLTYDNSIARAESEIRKELERNTRRAMRQIRSEQSQRVSAHMMENRRRLFSVRNECSAQLLLEVRHRVEEFVKTDEYPEVLIKLLDKGMETLGRGSVATIVLREQDLHLASRLGSSIKRSSLSFDTGDFVLGGIIVACPSKSVNIDMTFDAALLELDGHIAEMFGLDIE